MTKKSKPIATNIAIRGARKLARVSTRIAAKLDTFGFAVESAAHISARQLASKRLMAAVDAANKAQAALVQARKDFRYESEAIDEAFGTISN